MGLAVVEVLVGSFTVIIGPLGADCCMYRLLGPITVPIVAV